VFDGMCAIRSSRTETVFLTAADALSVLSTS
jgi:hypothetical protein